MSSVGPNLKRGTPATCGELKRINRAIRQQQKRESKVVFLPEVVSPIYWNKTWMQFLTVSTYWIAWSRPSERCGTTRVGVLGTILSSSSKKCCCRRGGGKTLFRKVQIGTVLNQNVVNALNLQRCPMRQGWAEGRGEQEYRASSSQSLWLAAPWKKPPSCRPRLNGSQKRSAQDVQIVVFERKYSSIISRRTSAAWSLFKSTMAFLIITWLIGTRLTVYAASDSNIAL